MATFSNKEIRIGTNIGTYGENRFKWMLAYPFEAVLLEAATTGGNRKSNPESFHIIVKLEVFVKGL